MIDKTGQANLTTQTTAKTVNAKGNNEQWQRHLEKAYFERQRAAMQSETQDVSASSKSNRERHQLLSSDSVVEADAFTAKHTRRQYSGSSRATAIPQSQNLPSSMINHQNKPRVVFSGPLGIDMLVRSGNKLPAEHNLAKNSPVMAQTMWQSMLPASSSASLLVTEQGIHLVIRDNTLSAQDVLKLVHRLRMLFSLQGLKLWAVTLNGDRLWPGHLGAETEHSANEKSEIADHKESIIDRKY